MTSCTSPDDTGSSFIWCESVRAGSQRLRQLSSADSHSWVMLFVKLHQTWRDGEQSRISLQEATLLSVCCWIWCRPTDSFKLKQSCLLMITESKCWDIQDFIEDIPGVTILYGLYILYESVSLRTTHEQAVNLSDSLKHFYSREGEWGELLCFCCLLVKKTTLFSLVLLMWFSLHDFCFDRLFPAMKSGKKSTKSWFHQFILISSTLPRSS